MSARAACRLEQLGFVEVYDLIGGRASWTALGLPTQGAVGDRRRISAYLNQPATVPIDGTIGDARVAVAGLSEGSRRWPVAVVSADRVLLGSLASAALSLAPSTLVEKAMTTAPGTIRPDVRIDEVVKQLRDEGLDQVFVTAVNGTLFGLAVLKELHV